jgi:AAA domain
MADGRQGVLEPDRDQLEIFVNALFRYAHDGVVSLRSFFENRSEAFQIVPLPLNGSGLVGLIDIAEKMARHAANAAEAAVFCPPLATFRDGRRATEADIETGPVLSVECDADPFRACTKLEAILGPATVIVRSGGLWINPASGEQADKLHLHWRLAEPATGKQLALLKRARTLATRLAGGDPSNVPIVHPIRWPGSWHRKGKPRLCAIETANPDREIVLELALDALEAVAPIEQMDGGTGPASDDDTRRTEWEDAFRAILGGESYHPTLVPLAASFAAWGAPAPVTDNVLRSLLINSAPQDAERLRRRDAELAKLPQTVASAYAKFSKADDKTEQKQERLRWHGESQNTSVRAWLINGLLPETGVGLISGQWGTYKTFVAIDLAAAVMAGLAFIDYPIVRNGGILFIAAEGGSEIPARLQAVLKAKYSDRADKLPFSWIDECPRLLGPGAVNALAALAREAAERMQKDFSVALVLIVVDTMVDAAGYVRSGDENDAALAQLIMRRCAELSRLTGALVLGIDHFGKAVETGTRGSSAKEGRADVVLALLGDKAISGEVTNTRLAVRKNRAGPGGRELPFGVRSVDMGTDENGEPITSLVIEWSGQAATASPSDQRWSKSLSLLRRILMALLADIGKEVRPFADGPMVRACDLTVVREEFCKQYFADGTPQQKAHARRQAFSRAITAAQARELVMIRDIAGVQLIWLTKPEGSEPTGSRNA